MYSALIEAEYTVDAVLQEVIDSTQQWSDHDADDTQSFVSQRTLQSGYEHRQNFSTDQDSQRPATILDATDTRLYGSAVHSDGLSSMSQVVSAVNPLFLPAEPSRPQSAQLQQTLSAMSRQLPALEASMQQQTREAAQASLEQSVDTGSAAASTLQQGEFNL